MGTFNVNVKTPDGQNRQYIELKLWGQDGLVGTQVTDASGNASFTVPANTYGKLHAEDLHSGEFVPQWFGQNGAGVFAFEQAGVFVTTSGTITLNAVLSSDQQLFGTPNVDAIPYKFWVDTTDSNKILRLLPGEERRPFTTDLMDPLHKHVLRGPYPTYEAAQAAG